MLKDGLVAGVGSRSDLTETGAAVVDVDGCAIIPGLFDTHLHPSLNDFTERQEASGYIARSVAGGVTSFISAGECHVPMGHPRDKTGAKALAIAAHKVFESFRPLGAKVHAGSVLLATGMTRSDFEELRDAGVWLVGEIGLSEIHEPEDAGPMVEIAHDLGFVVIMHTGGASIPGSSSIGLRHVTAIKPDVSAHLNGGPTAVPDEEIRAIVSDTSAALEIINNGNPRSALVLLNAALEHRAESRLIIGNDMPSGVGVTTLGIIRTVAYLASVGGVDPARAIAYASGTAGRTFKRPEGVIAVGRPADVVVIDSPIGSAGRDPLDSLVQGDHPSIRVVIIDGEIQVWESPITPRGARKLARAAS